MDSATQHLAARYDAAAQSWHGKIAPLGYPEAYGELVQQLGHIEVSSLAVLDAGAGCGDFTEAFLAGQGAAKSHTLLDISGEMLEVAKTRLHGEAGQARFLTGEIESLPARPAFDLILCAHVVEHCPAPVAALSALRSTLRPDGRLLLIVSKPHWCTAIIRMIWRSKAYAPAKMRGLLAESGFGAVETYTFKAGPPRRTSMGYIVNGKGTA